MEYNKVKSASKSVLPRGSALEKCILETMARIADMVGGTLGPGGHPVLIERAESGMPPAITKDGVTVFRALGAENSYEQLIIEAVRDAATRTANEAGDGTTTATILAESFVRYTIAYCKENPNSSPQGVVREIQRILRDILLPEIQRLSVTVDIAEDTGRHFLTGVATVSGNGDVELARAVMECFDICGDSGNVSIVESSGYSHYEVERIDGYPIPIGFEESCAKFYPAFINEPGSQRVIIDKPAFILNFGKITDVQQMVPLLDSLQQAWMGKYMETHNVVLVATGFSEVVLASLANNWLLPGSINIFPLVVPQSPIANGARHFLDDLAAITGAVVLDQLSCPLEQATIKQAGNLVEFTDGADSVYKPNGVVGFECSRYRSTVIGYDGQNEEGSVPPKLQKRIDEVEGMVEFSESEMDAIWAKERLAKLTGGIAKLRVIGSSTGELRERRDRAEDAVCAVRGAMKDGVLPGGCWALMRLVNVLDVQPDDPSTAYTIVRNALLAPINRLLDNIGLDAGQKTEVIEQMLKYTDGAEPKAITYDASTMEWVDAKGVALLDSTPAVRQALQNAISIATVVGTLGGIIAFPRDRELERHEAKATAEFLRDANSNPADERS